MKTENHFGLISEKIIKERLDITNTDLNYILQFKTVDEVSALIDFLMNDLKKLYKNIYNYCSKNKTRSKLIRILSN